MPKLFQRLRARLRVTWAEYRLSAAHIDLMSMVGHRATLGDQIDVYETFIERQRRTVARLRHEAAVLELKR